MAWGKNKVKQPATNQDHEANENTGAATGLEDLFSADNEAMVFDVDLEPDDELDRPRPREPQPDTGVLDEIVSAAPPPPAPTPQAPRAPRNHASNIGASIKIEGELSGSEDISIEGTVEGIVSLPDNQLTVAAQGTVHAEVQARSVALYGTVVGNISATDMVQIMPSGTMHGDIRAGRVVLTDGAKFRGNIHMGWQPDAEDEARPKTKAGKADKADAAPTDDGDRGGDDAAC